MKKVLHVKSSPRFEGSVSRRLGNAVVDKILEIYPGSEVKVYDVAKAPFPHLNDVLMSGYWTPEENRTEEQIAAVKKSDEAIAAVKESDIIVIDSPMYNFTIPSTLKTFLDHITRANATFRYVETGVEGLVTNKKVYIAYSSGWIYDRNAPVIPDFNVSYLDKDFNVPFLKTLLGLLGMTDVTAFRADGAELQGIKEDAIERAFQSIKID